MLRGRTREKYNARPTRPGAPQSSLGRFAVLALALLVMAGAMVVRLVELQVVQHSKYLAMASRAHTRKYEIPAKRGEIYMRDGEAKTPLVLNQTLDVLYADPTFIKDKQKTADLLAGVTGDNAADYRKLLEKPGEYVVLKTKIPLSMAAKLNELNLIGVGLTGQSYRIYPEGSLASQIIGFVNSDGIGQYGLEGFLDHDLSGTPGMLAAKTDTRGLPIATADNVISQPLNGTSYVLTIDRNVQARAEQALEAGVKAVGAPSGSVVIMDPSTGAIKAMANYPSYDPNNYAANTEYANFSNAVVSNQFEPGSGFKVITMATGLDTGKVKSDTTYDDTGSLSIGGRTISNAENHKFGIQNMTDVIQKSLNTGVIFVLRAIGGEASINQTGKKTFYDYIKNHFGFGVRTGIEQAGEAAGQVNSPTAPDVNYANMTFGQGISVTMLQMVAAVGAIANGGTLYRPYLIDEVTPAGKSAQKRKPQIVNAHAVSATAASDITNMMIQVVLHGSGYLTRTPGYQIAGKTGTAQIPSPDGNGYLEGKNIGSFVGFAPVGNPKFVMMVRVNEPHTQGFAESTAVPIFGDIAKWLFSYYAIPPSG